MIKPAAGGLLFGMLLTLAGVFHVPAELLPGEQAALRTARPGDILQLDAFFASHTNLPVVPLRITATAGPQFLFSDKPEYLVSGNGIALREDVKPGDVRLYLYHVPTPGSAPKTITAVIENLGSSELNVNFLRRAFPKPGGDYHGIGKAGLTGFFNGQPPKISRLTIAARARAVLDPELDATVVTRNQLVHGFYEFTINQPARVIVFQRDPEQNSLAVIDALPLLPQTLPEKPGGNGAGRGLFPICNFAVTNAPEFVLDSKHGPGQIMVADPKRETWIEGRDSIDGKPSRNVGNYGVVYRIRLARASGDGRGLALLMCKKPSFSQWCGGQSGAVKVSRGVWPAGVVPIPAGASNFGKPGEAVLLQKFPPLPAGTTGVIEIEYSPPGASCIPTPMLLVPYEE